VAHSEEPIDYGCTGFGHAAAGPRVLLTEIAVTFARIASSAFGGGILALARRELVVERRWLGDDAFLELLALAQVLPGPNVTNLAVLVGSRLGGPLGAVVAFLATIAPAYLLLMAIAALVFAGGGWPWLTAALRGCAAGAVGLSLANAVELSARLRRDVVALAFVLAAAVAVAALHVSLGLVLVVLVPLSFAARRGVRA
jgi:chromate transporter